MNPIFLKQQIELAIKDHKWIKIDYVSTKHEITKDRIIEPQGFKDDKKGEPEVWGHCFLRNDLRAFQFEGIQKLAIVEPTEYGKC